MSAYTSINYPLVRTGSNLLTISNSTAYTITNGNVQYRANDLLYNQLVEVIYNYNTGLGYLYNLQKTIYTLNVTGKDSRKQNHEVYDLFVVIEHLMDFQIYVNRFVGSNVISSNNLITIISEFGLKQIRENIYAKYEDCNLFDQLFSLITIGTGINQIQIVNNSNGYIKIGSTLNII